MQELLEIYQQELKLLNEELNVAGGSADLIDENREKLDSGLAQYREAKQITALLNGKHCSSDAKAGRGVFLRLWSRN